MASDTAAIQRAVGEKAGYIVFGISRAMAGFVFAFQKGWLLSVLLLLGFPLIGGISTILFKAL